MPVDTALASAAFLAGAATFFSPCSVALLPAYAGYFLGLDRERPRATPEAARRGARFGAAAGAGVLGLFAIGAVLLYVVRVLLGRATPRLGSAVGGLGLAAGVAVLVLGVGYLLDRGPTARVPVEVPRERTLRGMAAFGVVFALVSLGCSLPVWLGIVVQALSQGPLGALVTLLAFGVGLAGLMAATGLLLGLAHDETRRRVKAIRRWARPVSGLVLVAAGVYMVWYYLAVVL